LLGGGGGGVSRKGDFVGGGLRTTEVKHPLDAKRVQGRMEMVVKLTSSGKRKEGL